MANRPDCPQREPCEPSQGIYLGRAQEETWREIKLTHTAAPPRSEPFDRPMAMNFVQWRRSGSTLSIWGVEGLTFVQLFSNF
jgi:hypothetical protein